MKREHFFFALLGATAAAVFAIVFAVVPGTTARSVTAIVGALIWVVAVCALAGHLAPRTIWEPTSVPGRWSATEERLPASIAAFFACYAATILAIAILFFSL